MKPHGRKQRRRLKEHTAGRNRHSKAVSAAAKALRLLVERRRAGR